MAPKELPEAELLRKLFEYDPETGVLLWRPRPPEMFDQEHREWAAQIWNGRCAGKPALNLSSAQGYKVGAIFGSKVKAHRVIWKLVTGEEPNRIDHINGDRGDNRFANLRSVDHLRNCHNQATPTHNTSGQVGVTWNPSRLQWCASIKVAGKPHFLGYHDDFVDAVEARKTAERRFGFHENHGRPRGPAYPSRSFTA